MSAPRRGFIFGTFFLDMHTETNEGGTRNLILRGNDLIQKIGQRVTDEDVVRIAKYLRENKDVVSLELPYNRITNCGVWNLVGCPQDIQNVKHLNLIGNDITHLGISYLADLGENLPFYSLRLTGNKIGDEGGRLLASILYQNTSLKFLDLSDTDQTMSGLAHVLTALMPYKGGTKTLEYIDIGRPLPQAFHQVHDAHVAEFLTQVLTDNTTLKEIHLQQYHFDFRDMEILLDGLLANKSLVCLDLNNNGIGDDGVKYLCTYLETKPQLECLMVGANRIGNHGALNLSRSLPYSKIRLLDLTNNHITDEGMINIFYTIKKPDLMRSFFIWGNKLTHKSLVVLQHLFATKLLDPDRTDIRLYFSNKELHASWNYEANRYTNRFYCVSSFENFSKGKYMVNPSPPQKKPEIYYKYHVDNKDIGFPMCEWEERKSSNYET